MKVRIFLNCWLNLFARLFLKQKTNVYFRNWNLFSKLEFIIETLFYICLCIEYILVEHICLVLICIWFPHICVWYIFDFYMYLYLHCIWFLHVFVFALNLISTCVFVFALTCRPDSGRVCQAGLNLDCPSMYQLIILILILIPCLWWFWFSPPWWSPCTRCTGWSPCTSWSLRFWRFWRRWGWQYYRLQPQGRVWRNFVEIAMVPSYSLQIWKNLQRNSWKIWKDGFWRWEKVVRGEGIQLSPIISKQKKPWKMMKSIGLNRLHN